MGLRHQIDRSRELAKAKKPAQARVAAVEQLREAIAPKAKQAPKTAEPERAKTAAYPGKKLVSLRIDVDVLDYFKQIAGEKGGWQTLINAELRKAAEL